MKLYNNNYLIRYLILIAKITLIYLYVKIVILFFAKIYLKTIKMHNYETGKGHQEITREMIEEMNTQLKPIRKKEELSKKEKALLQVYTIFNIYMKMPMRNTRSASQHEKPLRSS